jgi:hypothetical protein
MHNTNTTCPGCNDTSHGNELAMSWVRHCVMLACVVLECVVLECVVHLASAV